MEKREKSSWTFNKARSTAVQASANNSNAFRKPYIFAWCLNTMAFVRVKRINGGRYAYLVENSWTRKGARQKVSRYLGRVHAAERSKSESLAAFLNLSDLGKYVRDSDFPAIARDLIRLELHNHGVKGVSVNFQEASVLNEGGKEVTVAMNEGFLCSHTLKSLLKYGPEEDYSGYKLADLITAAGVVPEQDVFIELHGKFRAKSEDAVRSTEFYY